MKKNFILLFLTAFVFAACSPDYEIIKSDKVLILTADTSVRIIGEPITFTVKDDQGADLTADSEFYVNDEPIEGNSYISDAVGNFTITANYSGAVSAPITVNFHDGSEIYFTKRLLIEDYTGTWCGYCPRVAHAIELVKAQTENIVPVAIHRSSLVPTNPNYDPYTFDSSQLESLLGAVGYPKGYLNRMTKWRSLEDNHIEQPVALTQGENPKLGLAMNSTVQNGNISIDVKVKFGKDFSNLRLVVYVLENGLIHEQHNYTPYYNGEDVILNFEHNHVLRACLTPLLGEAITGNTTIANTYTKTFTVPVPATVENAAKLEFVAFVTDANNNAINVRSTKPGENQEFELQ